MITDVIGQPIRNGQRCVFMGDTLYNNRGRMGTVADVTEKQFNVIFDEKPGNVRGTRFGMTPPIVVNIDGIVDKYPENFL